MSSQPRLAPFFALLLSLAPPVAAAPRDALLVEDLAALGATAEARDLPIVLLMSASYCGYCDRVREEFLVPMVISDAYHDRALLAELPIDGGLVTDFDGTRRLAEAVAERYGVSLVPVLLFLDGDGREVARRMVGLGTVDFYGAYLEAAIDQARAAIAAEGDR